LEKRRGYVGDVLKHFPPERSKRVEFTPFKKAKEGKGRKWDGGWLRKKSAVTKQTNQEKRSTYKTGEGKEGGHRRTNEGERKDGDGRVQGGTLPRWLNKEGVFTLAK